MQYNSFSSSELDLLFAFSILNIMTVFWNFELRYRYIIVHRAHLLSVARITRNALKLATMFESFNRGEAISFRFVIQIQFQISFGENSTLVWTQTFRIRIELFFDPNSGQDRKHSREFERFIASFKKLASLFLSFQ